MNDKIIREFIEKKVAGKRNTDLRPRFYVESGATLYGFEDEDSDIDVRGFHQAPAEQYAKISTPSGQIEKIEEKEDTEIDLVSFELKKYGNLIYKMSFNVLEQILCGRRIMSGVPLEISSIQKEINDRLPASVAISYRGMAKSNYEKYLNPNMEAYKPYPKKYLYVIRGLLAAEHVSYEEEIVADIRELADSHGGSDIVDRLIEEKREGKEFASNELAEDANNFIVNKFNSDIVHKTEHDTEEYERVINNWMEDVRNG